MEDPFEQNINQLDEEKKDIVQEIAPGTPLDENKNEVIEINKNDVRSEEFEDVVEDEEIENEEKINDEEKTKMEEKIEEVEEDVKVEKDNGEENITEDKEDISEASDDKEMNDEEKTEDQVPDITATDGGDPMTTSMDGIDEIPEEEIKMPAEGGAPGDETQVVVNDDNVIPTTPSEDLKEAVVEEIKEETAEVVEEAAEDKVEEVVEDKPTEISEDKVEDILNENEEEQKEGPSEVVEEKKEEESSEVVEEKNEEVTENIVAEAVEEKTEITEEVTEEKKEEVVEEVTTENVEEKIEEIVDEVKDEKGADSSVAPSEHEFELQPPPTPKRKITPCELDNPVAEQEQEATKIEIEETAATPQATTPVADISLKESIPPTPKNEESAKDSVSETPAVDDSSKEIITDATTQEESVKEEVPATPVVEESAKESVPQTPIEESVKESISESPANESIKEEPSIPSPQVSITTPKTSISTPKTPSTPKRSVTKSGTTPRSKKSTSKFAFDDVAEPVKKDSVPGTPKSAKLSVSGTPAEIISEATIVEEPKEEENTIPEEVAEAPTAENETVEEVQAEDPVKNEPEVIETEVKESNDEEVKGDETQVEEAKAEELQKVDDSEQVRKVSYREPEAEIRETTSVLPSQRVAPSTDGESKEPPARNYQPYDQDSHRVTGPSKLQSNSSFSSWMPTETSTYSPRTPYAVNSAHKYNTDYISSYRSPSGFYTTMFDDIVSTGPFSSSLYATNRLLERSRSRTRERKSALRNIRSSSNYTKYIASAPSPMRTREYSTPPSREISRAPSRSGSFISFMEYSGSKQYELARDNTRNNIYNSLSRSTSRGDVDLYTGSGRLSRVDSYVSKMNHNYDYETPKTYSIYRSTSRPNISYTPSYASYVPSYTDNDSTLSRMKRYARETVNPTGYRSMYEPISVSMYGSITPSSSSYLGKMVNSFANDWSFGRF